MLSKFYNWEISGRVKTYVNNNVNEKELMYYDTEWNRVILNEMKNLI